MSAMSTILEENAFDVFMPSRDLGFVKSAFCLGSYQRPLGDPSNDAISTKVPKIKGMKARHAQLRARNNSSSNALFPSNLVADMSRMRSLVFCLSFPSL